MTDNLTMGRQLRTRECLVDIREQVMKNHANKKKTNVSAVVQKHNLFTMISGFLVEMEVLAVTEYAGQKRTADKMYEWIYNGTETGSVDAKLVDKVVQKVRDYQTQKSQEKRNKARNTKDEKREGSLQVLAMTESKMKKLPTSKDDKMEQVTIWLQEKLDKNDQVHGYIRADEAVIYKRIIDIFKGFTELKEAIKKIM